MPLLIVNAQSLYYVSQNTQSVNLGPILIAHSDVIYCTSIRSELLRNGYQVSIPIANEYAALGYLIKYKPRLAILEASFATIMKTDIENWSRSEYVQTQFILVEDYAQKDIPDPYCFVYKEDSPSTILNHVNTINSAHNP